VTITNSGNSSVTFGTAAVTSTNVGIYTKGADTCSGNSVAVSGTCTITVNFNGTTAGNPTRTGTLSVPSSAPNAATNNPAVLNLTGS